MRVILLAFAVLPVSQAELPLPSLRADPRPNIRRPNILFCFADDWSPYASFYTSVEHQPSINQLLKTPKLDRVARHGFCSGMPSSAIRASPATTNRPTFERPPPHRSLSLTDSEVINPCPRTPSSPASLRRGVT
jgi:hypothetical protein